MVKRVVIIADEVEFTEIFYALEIADGEFEIVRLHGPGELRNWNGIPIEGIDKIGEIMDLEYDFILIVSIKQDDISSILKRFVPEEKIWSYKMFIDHYLDEEKRMMCLRERIRRLYPQTTQYECGDFSYGRLEVLAGREQEKLTIGKFCSVADDVLFLLSADHRTDYCTTYPFGNLMNEFLIGDCLWSKGDIVVGNDVWIGNGAKILSGVTIGDGCIIGAGATVAKSIPPYSIVVGNPGRIVKKRFDEETIEKMLLMKWWDWSYKDIYHAIPLLLSADTDGLFSYYKENVDVGGNTDEAKGGYDFA